MKRIKLDLKNVSSFVDDELVHQFAEKAAAYREDLLNGTGAGNDFLGWVELPSNTQEDLITDIENVAAHFHNTVEVVVVIGLLSSTWNNSSIL